jgi:tetratricopeptide (TPR) repeat protein
MKGARCLAILLGLALIYGCATGSRSTRREPSDKARKYYEKGVALSAEGRYSDALSSLKKAVRAHADYGDAYYNMGVIYHKLGLDEDAIKAYEQAICINPQDAPAHNNLGNIHIRHVRLSDAIRELEEAVRIDPGYDQAHHNLALAYYLAKMYHRAWDEITVLNRLGVTPDSELIDAVAAALNPEAEDMKEAE